MKEFMGIHAPVQVGNGQTYQLDFEQNLHGVIESRKAWRFACRQCREARGTRVERWQSVAFTTGGRNDDEEREDRLSYEQALNEVTAHVEAHETMAAWYEQLAESPAFVAGRESVLREAQPEPKVVE